MKKTIIETYPRSGHHFLVQGLLMRVDINEIKYCEVYGHCATVPCTDSQTTIQKTHDFKLSDPILTGYKYLIQFRHPYESLASYFSLETNAGNISDSREAWRTFLEEKMLFWIQFMRKWSEIALTNSQFFNVRYQDLIYETHSTLRAILGFIEMEHFDEVALDSINANARSNTREFKYFDEEELLYVERQCKMFIDATGLERVTI